MTPIGFSLSEQIDQLFDSYFTIIIIWEDTRCIVVCFKYM